MGQTISNDISSERTQQANSKIVGIVLGRIRTKVVQRLVKFQILDLCRILFVFVNM